MSVVKPKPITAGTKHKMNQSEIEDASNQLYAWENGCEKVAGDFVSNKRLKQSKGKANTILVLTQQKTALVMGIVR